MARSAQICPHVNAESGRTITISKLMVEAGPGQRSHRSYPMPETAGCDECRAERNIADTYFAVPVKEDQPLLDALLEAVQRMGSQPPRLVP